MNILELLTLPPSLQDKIHPRYGTLHISDMIEFNRLNKNWVIAIADPRTAYGRSLRSKNYIPLRVIVGFKRFFILKNGVKVLSPKTPDIKTAYLIPIPLS